MEKRKNSWTPVIVVIVLVIAAGLGFSIYSFYSSGSAEKGIVVCDPNDSSKCLWQDHMHALVIVSADGVSNIRNLPLERGGLDKAHTHEERNVIHWHSSLPYDPVKQEVLDKAPFMLSNSLASIGIGLPEDGKMFVKKKSGAWGQRAEYGSYVWEDNDIIFVTTDSATNEEIISELASSDIRLPYLGVG